VGPGVGGRVGEPVAVGKMIMIAVGSGPQPTVKIRIINKRADLRSQSIIFVLIIFSPAARSLVPWS
jgi:hypothetical protein